jgi:hypothetical protein
VPHTVPPSIKKCSSTMYLEALLCYLPIGAMRIFGGGLICRQWSFFFFFLSLFPWKLQLGPLGCWYFNFSPYYFDFSFFILVLLYNFYLFLISFLNPNLQNIIFFNLILIIWISIFFLFWSFCKSCIGFYVILEFKLMVLCLSIWSSLFWFWIFFSWSFYKSYFFLISSFNYNIIFIFTSILSPILF